VRTEEVSQLATRFVRANELDLRKMTRMFTPLLTLYPPLTLLTARGDFKSILTEMPPALT
jgi:hypothetical protein